MYNLSYFKEHDPAEVIAFAKAHPFAFITGVDARNHPVATQIPVFIDEREGKLFLSGHLMRKTDHHLAFEQNPNVLAVFASPSTYVSASWYSDKRQGSTWNYVSVHAKGIIRFLDHAALLEVLDRTTAHYENDPDSGANFKDIGQEYVDRMTKAIVAFEIEVTELENVFKLSQNRDEKSYDNIVAKLKEKGGDGGVIASMMEERRSKLFPQ
jgi:transcriptional regulator